MDALATDEKAGTETHPTETPPPPRRATFKTHALVQALKQVTPALKKLKGDDRSLPYAWLDTAMVGGGAPWLGSITAGNGELWRRVVASCEDGPVFACGCDAGLLLELIHDCLDRTVTLELAEASGKRHEPSLTVSFGDNRYLMPAKDKPWEPSPWDAVGSTAESTFPPPPAGMAVTAVGPAGVALPWEETLAALRLVLDYAVPDNSVGAVHYTQAVLIERRGVELHAVATDGHRLGVARIEEQGRLVGENAAADAAWLLAMRPLARLLELPEVKQQPLRIVHDTSKEPALVVEWADTVFRAPLIDLKYPDWRKLRLPAPSHTLRLEAQQLRAALWRILHFARRVTDYNPILRLKPRQGWLDLSFEHDELAACTEGLPAQLEGGDGLVWSCSPSLLHAMVGNFTGTVELRLTQRLGDQNAQPGLLTADCAPGFRALLMPISVD